MNKLRFCVPIIHRLCNLPIIEIRQEDKLLLMLRRKAILYKLDNDPEALGSVCCI